MTAFSTVTPLTTRVTLALAALRAARFDGDAARIYIAQRRFDQLVDRLPAPTEN